MLKSNFEEYEQKNESKFDFVVLYQNHCMCLRNSRDILLQISFKNDKTQKSSDSLIFITG